MAARSCQVGWILGVSLVFYWLSLYASGKASRAQLGEPKTAAKICSPDSLGAGIISTRSRFTALIRMHNSNHLLDHPSHTNTRKHTIFSLRGGEGGVVYAKSKSEFDQVLKDAGDNLVVVDFTASWCGPCKMIAPFFESLKDNYPNITLLKVDVDENEETAQYFEIGAMPTFMFFKKGKKLGFFCGASEENLRANVEKYINSQADD